MINMDEDILEMLSDLEHVQWCKWSQSVSKEISLLLDILDKFNDDLSEHDLLTVSNIKDKLNQWNELWVDYSQLSEQ